jgi:hypothetical protein
MKIVRLKLTGINEERFKVFTGFGIFAEATISSVMKKICLLTFVCLTSINIATAQKKRYPIHELSVSVLGGQSNLVYKLDNSSHSGGFGGTIDVGYTYNLKRLFGIVTGINISMYNSKLNMDNCLGEYTEVDMGDEFTFKYSLTGYNEQHSIVLFSIPVMLRYSKPLGKKGWTKYYITGGFKFGIPVSAQASIDAEKITTSGHYEYEDGTYVNLERYGFVIDKPGEQSDYNIKLNLVGVAALETGIRFRIGYQKDLMAGLFVDYSLNNLQKVNNRHVLEYQHASPTLFRYNSIINTKLLSKVNLLSFGLKVGLSF